jgi:Tfp pilus assembly protein PilF
MRNIFIFFSIFFFISSLFGNEEAIELARQKGYQAKLEKNYPNAINYYQEVLEINPDDYDAKLALGRLFILQKDFSSAREFFNLILSEDKTDLEAYYGLFRISELEKHYPKQIYYLKKILEYAPTNISSEYKIDILFKLSSAYENNQQYRLALNAYDKILNIDETYAEAWAEKGKLAYWTNSPFKAEQYYKTAIKLDSTHLPYKESLRKIQAVIKLNYKVLQNYLYEKEDNLKTNNYYQTYQLSKRITDLWESELDYHLLYSHRNNSGYKTAILDDFLRFKNRIFWKTDHYIDTDIGYSFLDDKFFNYKFSMINFNNFSSISLRSQLSYNNEIFEYFNNVSRKFFNYNIKLSGFNSTFIIDYNLGQIDNNYVGTQGKIADNNFINYSFELTNEIMENLNFGINYRFNDFAYKSDLYYSPINVKLYGIVTSYYWDYKKLYNYISSNFQIDNNHDFEQSFTIEFGYDFDYFSASISYSKFNNIYYKSDSINCLINGKF